MKWEQMTFQERQAAEAAEWAEAHALVRDSHRDLVAAIADCLDDEDPVVVRAGRQVLKEEIATARSELCWWRGLRSAPQVKRCRIELQDLHRLERS